VQLYARAAADAVLEGKAAAPIQGRSDEGEFVELDADGNPVSAPREHADHKPRPAAKKAPAHHEHAEPAAAEGDSHAG
jgi:small subunit ribosomal protein S2